MEREYSRCSLKTLPANLTSFLFPLSSFHQKSTLIINHLNTQQHEEEATKEGHRAAHHDPHGHRDNPRHYGVHGQNVKMDSELARLSTYGAQE